MSKSEVFFYICVLVAACAMLTGLGILFNEESKRSHAIEMKKLKMIGESK